MWLEMSCNALQGNYWLQPDCQVPESSYILGKFLGSCQLIELFWAQHWSLRWLSWVQNIHSTARLNHLRHSNSKIAISMSMWKDNIFTKQWDPAGLLLSHMLPWFTYISVKDWRTQRDYCIWAEQEWYSLILVLIAGFLYKKSTQVRNHINYKIPFYGLCHFTSILW